LARDRLDGEAGAAAGVAVKFGEDDARDVQPLVEGFGDVHGVLPGHRVDSEQDLIGGNFAPDIFKLGHEGVVDVQAACRVDDDGIVAHRTGVVYRLFRRLYGI